METRLDQLIQSFINEPTEEIKQEIINESKNTSRISLIYIIGVLKSGFEKETNEDKKKKFSDLSNALLVELKQENIVDTTLNPETGKLEATPRKL